MSEKIIVADKRLGALPAISHMNQLFFNDYLTKTAIQAPAPPTLVFWRKRKPIPILDLGNNEYGDCGIASQVIMHMKNERIEQKKTIVIPKDNVIKTYLDLTKRLYGGGDTGLYETDALNNWRNPDTTFRDDKGRPYTIDAYTRVNQANVEEVKKAIFYSGSKGVKVCFALPIAWANTLTWDIPLGQKPIGDYLPASWGDHSMTSALDYDEEWVYLDHTWRLPTGRISWRAFVTYATQVHSIIDSVDTWRVRVDKSNFNLKALVSDVNNVSDLKIK